MIQSSPKSERDLLSSENGPLRAGLTHEAHTGTRPAATEGRVKGGAAERQRSLEASRAAGTAPSQDAASEGSITPRHTHFSPKNPLVTGQPTAISPLTIDGYTRLEIRVPTLDGGDGRGELSCEAIDFLEDLSRLGEFGIKGEKQVELPVELASSTLAGPLVALCTASGSLAPEVVLKVEGAVYIRWNSASGRVNVQAKASYLWANGGGCNGWRVWANDWIVGLHKFFFSREIELSEAHAAGWNVTGVEVCKDLEGLPDWQHEDRSNFLGARKIGFHGSAARIETVSLGLRTTSSASILLYDKSAELEQKGADPTFYERVWLASGWQGGRVQRAELRLRDKCLVYTDGTNLRDPMTLCDAEAIDRVWQHEMSRKRLVVPTVAARRNCPTDPRWEVIQEGTGEAGAVKLEQDRRPREDAHRWRTKRVDEQLIDYAARACAMRGLTEPVRTTHELLRMVERALTRTEADVLNRFTNRRAHYGARQMMWFSTEIETAKRELVGAPRKYRMRKAA